ncbi:hypothetical protein ACJJIW_12915 [Microbulbifer sp. JMSA004]|uniref:hypothetical protein n=1 Tax=Microbulbifer sp. JMSA004 TaxID=3243370 RepID=UPI00403A7C4E
MDLLVFTGSRRPSRRAALPCAASILLAVVLPELFKRRQKILAQMRRSAGIYWLAPAKPAGGTSLCRFNTVSTSSS